MFGVIINDLQKNNIYLQKLYNSLKHNLHRCFILRNVRETNIVTTNFLGGI